MELIWERTPGKGESEKSSLKNKALGALFVYDLMQARRGAFPKGQKPKLAKTFPLQEYGNSLLSEAEASIPKDTFIDASSLQKGISDLRTRLTKGGQDVTSIKRSLSKLNDIENSIIGGHIEASQLPAFRRSINEAIEETGHWSSPEIPRIKKASAKNLADVRQEIVKMGEEYGKTNPEFLKNWKEGNEVLSVLHKSRRTQRAFESLANKITSNAGKSILGLAAPASKQLGKAVGIVTTPAAVIERYMSSPAIRNLYIKTLKQAAKEDWKGMSQSAIMMDKLIKKQEDEDRRRFSYFIIHR